MKQFNFKNYFLIALLALSFASCKKDSSPIEDVKQAGKYENGFFIVNEGWYGHGTGEVKFYDYNSGKLADSIYKKENPAGNLNPATSTLQYAALFNGKIYLVSKVGGPVVVLDAKTFKETGRMAAKAGNDWRAFLGLDARTALLSSNNGVYVLDLKTMTANIKLAASAGQVGDMFRAGQYIYTHSATDGAVIYNADDFSLVKKIKNVRMGFAQTPNGRIWYTNDKFLYSTNPVDLSTDSVALGFTSNSIWGAWHSSSLVASTKENAVYVLKTGSFAGGTDVYKYIAGNPGSLDKPFASLPARQIFYGKGIGFDAKLGQVVITSVQDGFGQNFAINHLYFYDAISGELKKTVDYDGFHFPALLVFSN
ncbi:DUF5074 domain-containing protein [Pedobacter nutrimenti]|jgi:hypothetical protein|uniref:Uncharacterized protein DUF5074 n=1 Tax=Pedobacter nutrimenti TaxID=1241337 RepID=A0A318UM14_9SPHI|nr:DUF5074 domain-containing protein [Pedobacter nutrimenti]PYF76831.1 uncharacterized protein DUF5074 [Pedobacter nutrimenti]